MLKKLMKAKELEALYPVWRSATFLKYARLGLLPCTIVGKRYFFNPLDVEKFMESITKRKEGNYERHQ